MSLAYSLQLLNEMEIIVDDSNWLEVMQSKWDGIKQNIIEQATREAEHKSRLRSVIKDMDMQSTGQLLSVICVLGN